MDNQKQTQKNKISEMIESSLDSIRGIADSGTVIGTPITTVQGTTIIPVSKVSVGFAGGGNDFSGKNGGDGKSIFSGGGGTGISVVPQAFLVISEEGRVQNEKDRGSYKRDEKNSLVLKKQLNVSFKHNYKCFHFLIIVINSRVYIIHFVFNKSVNWPFCLCIIARTIRNLYISWFR